MKIAIIKLGANFTLDTKRTVGIVSGEAINLARLLADEHEIILTTKITSRSKLDTGHPNIKLLDTIKDQQEFIDADHLIIWCGYVNFWGGVENAHYIEQWRIINQFKKNISFIYTDTEVPLIQVWDYMRTKEWAKKYNKDDLWISRNDIRIYTQTTNIDYVKKTITENVPYKDIQYIDLWKMPVIGNTNPITEINENPKYDIGYGGVANRPKRYPKIIKWFYNTEFNKKHTSCVYGRDLTKDKVMLRLLEKENDYIQADYIGKAVFGQDTFEFNNENCLATVVIGDPEYEHSGLLPNRYIEAILSNVVAFIDLDLDKNKTIVKNKELSDFLYISTNEELSERILMLRNDPEFRHKIIKLQHDEVGSKDDVRKELKTLFNKIINE